MAPDASSGDGGDRAITDGGTTLPDALTGEVRGHLAGPVEGAEITLTTADGVQLGQATTDASGRYRMPEFGSRLREEASTDRPELDVEVVRDGESVDVRHRSFDWNEFAAGGYTFDVAAAKPDDSSDGGQSSDGSTSSPTDPSGTVTDGVRDALATGGPAGVGTDFPGLVGVPDLDEFGAGLGNLPLTCECEDCESAVSPAAYLAHLLRYAGEHVEHRSDGSWTGIETGALEESFHQPFGRLPASCDAVTDPVRHVRVGTEALLHYLDTELTANHLDLFGPPGEGLIEPSVVQAYERDAYEALLNEWGVSLQELRTADYDEEERQSLAEQVGIAPEHVNGADGPDLFLNPDSTEAWPVVGGDDGPKINPEALTQTNLERIFGLPALTKLDPQNNVHSVQDPLDDVGESEIEQWRKTHVRNRWRDEDHSPDPFPRFVPASGSGGPEVFHEDDGEQRPAIDPDLVGPDDVREPTGDGAAISLWRQRRQWVDEQLASLWGERPAVDRMVEGMFSGFTYPTSGQQVAAAWSRTQIQIPLAGDESGPTVELKPGLEPLVELQTHLGAEGTDAETLRERVGEAVLLDDDEFDRLATLADEYLSDGTRLDEEKLWEVASLLVAARKRSLREEWIAEERNEGTWSRNADPVQLEPEQFWHSQREPDQGPWSSRLDAHASGGITRMATGTFTTPETPGARTVEVGFEPDVVVFTATVPGAADEVHDGRSGSHGWAHGAAQLHADGSVTQHALRVGERGDGSAAGESREDASFALPVSVDGSTVTVTGSVAGPGTGGFEVDTQASGLGDGSLPGVVVGYRAYRTAESASVEVGHFRTRDATGDQTVQFGVDPDFVSLTTTSLVDSAGASASNPTASVSRGQITGGTDPDQTVAASTLGGDSASYAAADDAAIDILYRGGGSLAGRTTATATKLDGDLTLNYSSVYDGQHNPGDARKLVAYVAVDAGSDRPAHETRPAVGQFETPADPGVVEVETGFEPALVEFTVCTAAGDLGTGSAAAIGWTDGAATPDGQHGFALADNAAADGHAALQSTSDAIPVLYADDRGRVSGRETGRVSLSETGFSVDFPVAASAAESAAPSDSVVVFYRAWPEGVPAEPYVDPDRVDRSDLPEVTAGGSARRLYEHRRGRLDDKVDDFETAYENASGDNPLDAVLDEAYGGSLFPEDWSAVLDGVAEAMEVEDRDPGPRLSILRLTTGEFETLRAVHRRAGEDSRESPSDQQLSTVFETLTTAWKLREQYPPASGGWLAEEQSGEWIGDVDDSVQPSEYSEYAMSEYWQARKAALPAWRASRGDRQAWQRALAERGRRPVVEPDVIDDDHVAAGNSGASTLLSDRESAVTVGSGATHSDLSGLASLSAGSFHAELEAIVGIDGAAVERIEDRTARGEDVSARLRQLDLTFETFNFLARVHGKVADGHPVSDHEWANVRHVLVQVWKRRRYGRWRREELAEDVFLDPAGFKIPEEDDETDDEADDDPKTRWRHHLGAVREWEDTLETRIDALDALDAQIADAVAAAEEAALPTFREKLVSVVGDHLYGEVTTDDSIDVPEPMLNDLPQLVTERLLIDVETSACRETTRVSQATTSIQRLLEALHRRYADSPGPVDQSFRLAADRFDEVWNWLGTYPKWKAAVGVYLYPENVLLPTMRERRTPGFRQLENSVQTGGVGQFTAGAAQEAAEEYADYVWDVLSLVADAGSLVEVDLPDEDGTTHLGYVFGQGAASETVYYRAFDPTTDRPSPPGDRDGLWKPVSPLSGQTIDDVVGACTYEGSVYVFVETGGEQSKLGYVVLDTDAEGGEWSDFSEISLPGDSGGDGEQKSGSSSDGSESQSGSGSESESDSRPIVAAEVVQVQGEDTPPELFVQLGRQTEGHDEWKEVTVHHGQFRDDGDPPESFEAVEFGLRDLHLTPEGELKSKPEVVPPFELQAVVRVDDSYALSESVYEDVTMYNVFIGGDRGHKKFWYHPEEILDSQHYRNDWYESNLNGKRESIWPNEKESLEDEVDEELDKDEPDHDHVDYLKNRIDLIDHLIDTDFRDGSDVEELASYLDHPSTLHSFTTVSPDTNSVTVTARWLRNHLIEGDWRSVYVDEPIDHVVPRIEYQDLYAFGQPGGTGTQHQGGYVPGPAVLESFEWQPGTSRIDNVLVCNNQRETDFPDEDVDPYLGKPLVVQRSQGRFNTYFGFTTYDLRYTDDVLPKLRFNWSLYENRAHAETLGPIGPRFPESDLWGEWLTGVTFPLDEDDDLEAEKDRHYDRTETMLERNFDSSYERSRSILPYVEEAYFQVPLLLARQLSQNGEFEAALDWFGSIYDHTRPVGKRKLWYYLRQTGIASDGEFDTGTPWLADPMRPHDVARTRRDSDDPYTKFTQLSLIECLVGFGDDEFARDTPSSVARATSLYEEALDVLDAPELAVYADPCERASLSLGDGLDYVEPSASSDGSRNRRAALRTLRDFQTAAIESGPSGDGDAGGDGDGGSGGSGASATGELLAPGSATVADALATDGVRRTVREGLLRDGSVARAITRVGAATEPRSWSSDDGARIDVPMEFCVPTNPWPKQLRRQAESNLEKIRDCRNIAGMKRELGPYAASTGVEGAVPTPGEGGGISTGTTASVEPTDYRYSTLIKRAKELVRNARQIESEYLSAIERMEQEEYKLRKARQDVELAEQRTRLQELRVERAQENVELAQLQRERSQIKVGHYRDLLSSGLIDSERKAKENLQQAIDLKKWAFGLQLGAAGLHLAASIAAFAKPTDFSGGFSSLASMTSTTASAFSTQASMRSTWSQFYQMEARYARRNERWKFQRDLAQQSVRIGDQKVAVAREEVGIARQRREISELKADQSRDMINYLSEEQFTDRELYQWMSGVLGRVYRYFLQEAAATAKLAERQLAFQRQEQPPGIIQSGYWGAPTDGGTAAGDGSEGPDRRGVTGSARLLRDVEQLDQHAMETDERALKVEKTIPLSELDPIALQQFRETGVVSFATPMELFDRDAPGRYHRLIDDVSVSIVALTPPTKGINATLRTSGTSWVVVGDTVYRKKPIRRDSQSIALDRAQGEEREREVRLEPSDREMLRPFENSGVETEWELRMPKAANQFDYDTIADVMLTIEYSAFESYDYRRQVQDRLDTERVFDRTFSVKDDLGDEWYELHNPETASEPMTVSFETERSDFPPNLTRMGVDDLSLYFVGPDGEALERLTVDLQYAEDGDAAAVGGEATPVEGMVATPSASSWNAAVGKSPIGEWTLSLPDSGYVRRLFEDGEVEDVLFVVSIEGEVPEWPR